MLNSKRILSGMLVLTLLGWMVAPYRAAASVVFQAGTKTYQVTVTNITSSKQGLSPLMIATHPASVHAWQMGQQASKGTEMLAEEGMPDLLASELKGSATDVVTTKAHLLPGDSITVTITAKDGDVLSAASMLIQTNDGFTGLDSVPLVEGNTEPQTYDAGTEDNSELAADVPGPPFGGKNHGPDTNPHQPISMHPGIAGKAEVTPDFNWSGPVARFTIRAYTPPATPAGMTTYEVTVMNIIASKQGLSPLLVASHPATVHAWQMGQQASKGLELVAEEGMPPTLASELQGVATDVATTNAHMLPGDSITVKINAKQGDVLSAATMLIQTNDGFTGLDSVPFTDGDRDTMAYDAGTEDNTELAADVPGPPFGGKNHGPDTNPHQAISMHPGIAAKAEVTPDFNWSGPVARFTVRAVSAGTTSDVLGLSGSPAAGSSSSSDASAGSDSAASPMPGMPETGVGDVDTGLNLLLVAGLAALLACVGFVLRRSFVVPR